MNNNTQNSSNITGGLKTMNLRFWGGWFLAIACVCIFLTMGCESGSLGVKYATVYGRLVNKDNVSLGVPNATVRMVSKETISGGGELEQGYNFLATVTDAEGYFVFEKVHPDNVIFEFSAPGYRKLVYPSTSSSTEDDGSTSEAADIESVTVANGASVDLANILMEKVSVTLPSEIKVRVELIDSKTKDRVDDNLEFEVSFDGVTKKNKAGAWRQYGVEGILGANKIDVSIRNVRDHVLYNSTTTTIDGTCDQYVSIEVEPVTYSLTFQFLNVPEYILSSTKNKPVLSILVEDTSSTPAKSIDIVDVESFGQLVHLDVSAVKNPQQVRLRMHGYYDEVLALPELDLGKKGSYRIDVDFGLSDGHKVDTDSSDTPDDDPVTSSEFNGKIGMQDNVIRRNILVNIIGFKNNDEVSFAANIPLDPERDIQWSRPGSVAGRGRAENGAVSALLKDCPTYFDMYYDIGVYPFDDGSGNASSSYIISSGDKPQTIGVPEKGVANTFSVDVSKMEASATSN